MSDAGFHVEGALTRDPEIRFANNGKAVCSFSVAVNRKRGDEEYVSYFDCTAFGQQAENIAQSLRKGDRVLVVGSLTQDRWEDKDGSKRNSVKLLADSIGPSLRFCTTVQTKNEKKSSGDAPVQQREFDSSDAF